jgi:fermentation-respiration switch protein FrsA (DUF1100 family)
VGLVILSVLGLLAAVYALLCLFYFLVQERFIFVRFRLSRDHRFNFPGEFTERWLKVEDGAELHALHFKAKDAKGAVLYFHGNSGSLRRWGRRAPRFTSLGWDVLLCDYRGYGKSRGRLSEEALHDDAQRWYDLLLQDWPQQKIVVFGRSLGSGMAVPVAAANRPAALILESPFCELADAASHYLPILPYHLLLRYAFRNDRAIKRVTCPVTIFHGRRDNVVPFTSALKLYAAIPPEVPRELVAFSRGHHSDLYRFPRFRAKMRAALDRAVTPPSTFAPPSPEGEAPTRP